jgi:hypothetical protein
MSQPANIGLRRTSASGLAAEAGSLGGRMKQVGSYLLLAAAVGCGSAHPCECSRSYEIVRCNYTPGMMLSRPGAPVEAWTLTVSRDRTAHLDSSGIPVARGHYVGHLSRNLMKQLITNFCEASSHKATPLRICSDDADFVVSCGLSYVGTTCGSEVETSPVAGVYQSALTILESVTWKTDANDTRP